MNMKKIVLFAVVFSLLFVNIGVYSQVENEKRNESETVIQDVANDESAGDAATSEDVGGQEDSFTEINEQPIDFSRQIPADMRLVSHNDFLELYINEETTEVAVKDKRSGYIWYTNPQDREKDSKAAGLNKDLLASQMTITYYTPSSQAKMMNNYSDSVRLGQFDIETIENGVKITYRIGKESKVYVVPQVISKERMEEKILNNINETDAKKLLRQYRLLSLENVSESRKQELLAQYPSLKNGDIYVLAENVRDYMKESLQEIILSAGYTLEDMNEDHAANNVPPAQENKEVFKISIEYILEGENLVVRVPTEEIEYHHDSYPLYSIKLLEFFGAAGLQDEGYMLVPDGSGSLIYFNNNKLASSSYVINVYGNDRSVPLTERSSLIEQAYLPVFGMKKGENAFFAIIESGDAMARVCADISGRVNSYNSVCSEFVLIPNDVLDISDYSGNYVIMVYQPRIFKGDIKIRYAFLNGENANYAGMARYYRKYLEKQYGMVQRQLYDNVPFYLELVGAIRKVRSIAGVPINVLQPLTTYDQAIEIIDQLKKGGVEDVVLKYTGWANGGVHHTIPSTVTLISKLGGNRAFSRLKNYLEQNQIDYFMDFGIIYAYKNTLFDDFIVRAHASRYITKEIASIYDYNIATDVQDLDRGPYYIISPSRIPHIVDGMIRGLQDLSVKGVSIRDAAIDVNSDFRERRLIDRQQARDILVSQFEKMKNSGLMLMVEGGNAYSLPYVDHIINIPEESNRFYITDESIPFLQMVIRGHISYAGEPINLASDYRKAMLKAVEVGGGIHFTFIYDENSAVKETYYDHYYSSEYRIWLDRALDFYREVNEALKDVQGQAIENHEKLAENVYRTTFENGVQVIVNYNNEAVNIQGMVIEGKGYKVLKGGM